MKTEGICVYILYNSSRFKKGNKYRYTERKGCYTVYDDLGNYLLIDMFSSQFNDAFKKLEDIREEKIREILV